MSKKRVEKKAHDISPYYLASPHHGEYQICKICGKYLLLLRDYMSECKPVAEETTLKKDEKC